ncbi:MAG: F0F1 ATP synthase subunit epsilon [Clostridia bacterium]|nr:F0F1 ATP synthase subunit epsilon [Clostridia bacterium]
MSTYRLIISTSLGKVFDGQVERLTLRGAEGDLAILAGHVPLMTTVRPGTVSLVLPDGGRKEASCDGGLLTVGTGDTVALLEHFTWNASSL